MAISKAASFDILLVAFIAVSIVMSVVAFSKFLDGFRMFNTNTQSEAKPSQPTDSNMEAAPSYGSGQYLSDSGELMAPPVTDDQLVAPPQPNLASTFYSPVYESAQYILQITWGAVAGTLIWRGKVRSAWCKQGYDYDTFRLVARMRGSPVRVKLLNSVATAKNRLQLANELDLDWKTIDNHMEILTKSGLVEEKAIVGTTRYYVLTEHGRRILLLLADGESAAVPGQMN